LATATDTLASHSCQFLLVKQLRLSKTETSGDETFETSSTGGVLGHGATSGVAERTQEMEGQLISEHSGSGVVLGSEEQSGVAHSNEQSNNQSRDQLDNQHERMASSQIYADYEEGIEESEDHKAGNEDVSSQVDGGDSTRHPLELNPVDGNGYSDDNNEAFQYGNDDDEGSEGSAEEGDEWDDLPTRGVCFQVTIICLSSPRLLQDFQPNTTNECTASPFEK